ncbi:MAG: alpha-E domain-containing protein [Gallionella sp.]|nr:alpha-E domain-containing protein [Gallionella sp.]
MLSRVAERVYWLGRYLERAENTARLLTVYSTLLLDLPRGARIGWHTLVEITGSHPEFHEHHQVTDERSVIHFLLADPKNSSSILNSLSMARENARTTREIIPSEAWEQINNLYLFARDNVGKSAGRGPRLQLLQQIISYCQLITGLLSGAMSHNSGYNFIRIARSLERADMTTRIVDVGSVTLLPGLTAAEHVPEPYENTVWMSVLRSLSAYQMYRQHVLDRVNGEDVVTFLLQDAQFPRSVVHSLTKLESCLQSLPNNAETLQQLEVTRTLASEANIPELLQKGLLEYIDQLQVEIARVHACIASTWFLPVVSGQQQSA